MEAINTFNNAAAENNIESLGDKQVEVNFKALDYQMADRQREVKVWKPSYTSQRQK